MRTAATELFDIDIPIFAFSHCRDVVAAVTKAAGLGVLGAVGHSDRQLEIDLQWIEAEVGGLPYGVDLIVPAKYEGDATGGLQVSDLKSRIPAEHIQFLDDLLAKYDVPPLAEDSSGRHVVSSTDAPFSQARAASQLDIVFAHDAALIVNALGPPTPDMIERAHSNGRLVGALAGAAHHAQRHVGAGVDIIIAQGGEAGGHTGEIGSMVLIPEIVDAVEGIPVLGAGGVGRGRQMAAAMALGAQGVWCGSVWLTTEEAETHPAVKQKMLQARSSDTVRSRSRTGKPARQLVSAWTKEWDSPDTPDSLGMPMQAILIDDAIRRINRGAHTAGSGAAELANYFVGQVVGQMNESIPAARVVYEMVEEFVDSLERLNQWTNAD